MKAEINELSSPELETCENRIWLERKNRCHFPGHTESALLAFVCTVSHAESPASVRIYEVVDKKSHGYREPGDLPVYHTGYDIIDSCIRRGPNIRKITSSPNPLKPSLQPSALLLPIHPSSRTSRQEDSFRGEDRFCTDDVCHSRQRRKHALRERDRAGIPVPENSHNIMFDSNRSNLVILTNFAL